MYPILTAHLTRAMTAQEHHVLHLLHTHRAHGLLAQTVVLQLQSLHVNVSVKAERILDAIVHQAHLFGHLYAAQLDERHVSAHERIALGTLFKVLAAQLTRTQVSTRLE